MKDLVKKIITNILSYEEDVITLKKEIDMEIHSLIEPYQEQLNEEELEQLQNLLFSASCIAEEVGFKLGVRFVCELLSSVFRNN